MNEKLIEKTKLNKTDRVLILILKLCTNRTMTAEEVRECLGCPSRAQWYKILAELSRETDFRPSVLSKVREESRDVFKLSSKFRVKLLGGTVET